MQCHRACGSPLEAPQVLTGGHLARLHDCHMSRADAELRGRERQRGKTHTPETGRRMQWAVPRKWRVFHGFA